MDQLLEESLPASSFLQGIPASPSVPVAALGGEQLAVMKINLSRYETLEHRNHLRQMEQVIQHITLIQSHLHFLLNVYLLTLYLHTRIE